MLKQYLSVGAKMPFFLKPVTPHLTRKKSLSTHLLYCFMIIDQMSMCVT